MQRLRPLAERCVRAITRRGRAGEGEGFPVAIVLPLADGAAHEATKLQLEILRKYGSNPGLEAYPHITLKLGFPVVDFAPFEEFMRRLVADVAPLEISLRDFGFFDEGILFLEVEPNPEIEKLRRRILEELSNHHGIQPQEIEGSQYRFHVTLAYGLSSVDFAELRKSFSRRHVQLDFQANHIDLLCHTGRQWVTYQRTRFQGARLPVS